MNDQLIVTLKVDELKAIIDESVNSALEKNLPSKENSEETLLKRKDVAKLFGVSLVTVNEWMKQKRLPFFRVNTRVFFKKQDVLNCMDSIKKYARTNP